MDTKSVSAFLSSISTTYIWTTSLCCVCVCKLFYLLYPPAEYEHWIETVRIQYIFLFIYIYYNVSMPFQSYIHPFYISATCFKCSYLHEDHPSFMSLLEFGREQFPLHGPGSDPPIPCLFGWEPMRYKDFQRCVDEIWQLDGFAVVWNSVPRVKLFPFHPTCSWLPLVLVDLNQRLKVQ